MYTSKGILYSFQFFKQCILCIESLFGIFILYFHFLHVEQIRYKKAAGQVFFDIECVNGLNDHYDCSRGDVMHWNDVDGTLEYDFLCFVRIIGCIF